MQFIEIDASEKIFIFFSHTFEQLESYAPESSMVWIDMEMTGLDYETETIMEIACIITDKDLNIIAEADDLILKVRKRRVSFWLFA